MKKYTLEVVITEGNDEFWESLGDKSGADEILECFIEELNTTSWGFLSKVKLLKYTRE